MLRRSLSRALVGMCIVYLILVIGFHRQLLPDIDSAASDDYDDGEGKRRHVSRVIVHDHVIRDTNLTHRVSDSVTGSALRQGEGGPNNRPSELNHQLQQLEQGMTQLEQQIADVKSKLTHQKTLSPIPKGQQQGQGQTHQGQDTQEEREKATQTRTNSLTERPKNLVHEKGKGAPRLQEDVQISPSGDKVRETINHSPPSPPHPPPLLPQLKEIPRVDSGVVVMGQSGMLKPGEPGTGTRDGVVENERKKKLKGRRTSPSMQVVKKKEENIFKGSSLLRIADGAAVYSAYFDDRSVDKPYIRLMTIIMRPRGSRIYCHFNYSASKDSVIVVEAQAYEMCENHGKLYGGFIYSCPVPVELRVAPLASYSVFVSLFEGLSENEPVFMPVQSINPSNLRAYQIPEDRYFQFRYNFSVCVSPLFGSVSARRLVEFVELTRLLGVQQVFFYDFSISSTIRKVLHYYQDKGWVTVLPWKLPPVVGGKIWYHGQLVSNNDCLYRTMALSAYTAFHDIDEFIVPHGTGLRTLADIIPAVLPNDTCGYSFYSSFFNPNLSKPSDPYAEMMTVSRTVRTTTLSKVRTKVLVASRRVFEVGIHHVSKQFREHWQPRAYDSDMAIMHHYRRCIPDYGMSCVGWTNDTTIKDHYRAQLQNQYFYMVISFDL